MNSFVAGNYNNGEYDRVQPVYQPTTQDTFYHQYQLPALTSPRNVTKPEVVTSNWNTDWVAVERPYAVRKTVEAPVAPVLSYNDDTQYFEDKDELVVTLASEADPKS